MLHAGAAGQRQAVFVCGEAGVGKTALVEAFVAGQALPGGWCVAQGRCVEGHGPHEPYLPLLEALEQIARHVGARAFATLLRRHAPAWLAQLPWLAAELDAGQRTGLTSETTAHHMLHELAHGIDELCQAQPLLLWFEDLHWCDASSLQAIAYLAGRRGPARLVLLASLRPGDTQAPSSPLQGLRDRLLQLGQASEIALGALDLEAMNDLARQRLLDASDDEVRRIAALVHHRTEGHALFAVALLDELARGRTSAGRADGVAAEGGARGSSKGAIEAAVLGAVEGMAGGAVDPGVDGAADRAVVAEAGEATRQAAARVVRGEAGQLPESLRRLVRDQVHRLPADERRVIEAAAVAGLTFSAASVAAALQTAPADTEERCLRLVARGLLRAEVQPLHWPDGTVSAAYSFTHALFCRGVLGLLAGARLAEWQGRIASRLEQACAGAPEEAQRHCAELAMRFEQAHDPRRSLVHLRRAADAALARCAYPEAIELLQQGVARVPGLPADERPGHELALRLTLGGALMAARGYAAAEVEANYRRALTLCATSGRPGDHARALRGMWNVEFLRCDLRAARRTAERLLDEALALGDARLAFDAHTKLGQTCLHRCELAAARRHLEAALGSAVAADDPAGRRAAPRVAAYLAWAHWYAGDADLAASACIQALALARACDSPHSQAFAFGYVSWVRLQRGEDELAQALAQQQLALARAYGLAYWRQLAEFIVGAVAARREPGGEGIAAMHRAVAEMQADGGEVGVPYLLCMLAEAQADAGRLAEAEAGLADAARRMRIHDNGLHAGEAWRLRGRIAQRRQPDAVGHRRALRCIALALATARRQGAQALEARAAAELARLERPGAGLHRQRGFTQPAGA